jgi:hypothetical protein
VQGVQRERPLTTVSGRGEGSRIRSGPGHAFNPIKQIAEIPTALFGHNGMKWRFCVAFFFENLAGAKRLGGILGG